MNTEEMFKEVFAEQPLKVEKEIMRQGQYPNPEVWQNTITLLRNVRERLANIKGGVQSTILDYHPYVDCMIAMINSVESSIRVTLYHFSPASII